MVDSTRHARVAVAQLPARPGDIDANVATVVAAIETAGARGDELVVFPECALSGYMLTSKPEVESAALGLGSARFARVVEACASASVHAVVGFLELDQGVVYNSAATVGPGGILGNYRKQHLPFLGADRFLAPGDGQAPRVVSTPVGNVGVMICFDLRFPESARTLALQGADIIAMPTNWPGNATFLANHMTRVRAVENLVYLAVADRADEEAGTAFLGRSQIVSPTGDVLVDAGTVEGIFSADVDISLARTKRLVMVPGEYELAVFDERKPALYQELTRPVE